MATATLASVTPSLLPGCELPLMIMLEVRVGSGVLGLSKIVAGPVG